MATKKPKPATSKSRRRAAPKTAALKTRYKNRLGGHTNSYHTYSLEEALEGIAAEDRARIDPAVALVVERNLLLIDTAIADSRKALQGQPGSLVAQASLFDAYRQKVALLQDLIAMASEVKRTGVNGAGRDRRPS